MADAMKPRGVAALIPARGGSKGLPGKNIRPLGGHPLIAWAIAVAKAAPSVDRVFCSTDSAEIAAVARAYGAEVPFLRPAELAGDFSTDLEVFDHFLRWLDENEGATPELVVQLRPTTPFRDPLWIDESVAKMLADPTITCVRSITPAPHTPYKMWTADEGLHLSPLMTLEGVAEPFNMPRQKLPTVYWHTGQLDVIRSETILGSSMTGNNIHGIRIDIQSAIDIDDLRDFQFAEIAFDDVMPASVRSAISAAAAASNAA